VIEGFLLNLQVLLFAVIGVAIFGTFIATFAPARTVFFPLRALARGYTDLFRGLPAHHRALPGRLRDPGPASTPGSRSWCSAPRPSC
jgi:hypothetical protein